MNGAAATELRKRVEQLGELPTLPHMVQKLRSTIGRPHVSAEEFGKLIKDQVLSAKVLRLANSPFYGFLLALHQSATQSSCSG